MGGSIELIKTFKQRQLAALKGHKFSNIGRYLRGNREMGFVVFDCVPPAGVPWVLHCQNLNQAIELASRFLMTDYTQQTEWVLAGATGRILLMTLPQLRPQFMNGVYAFDEGMGATRIGDLFHRAVFYNENMPANEMLVFNSNGKVCRFLIQNPPV